ncbi:MAG: hypothetical protein MK066_08590 [Crocinitomicaceae bacterium]|nr:hypothetical protein [Crocinitomicaceae bacterium]
MKQIVKPSDKHRALVILEQAFNSSPGMNWMLRRGKSKRSLKSFLSFIYHEAVHKNGAYITSDKNGVVLFYKLQDNRSSVRNWFRKLYVLFFVMGIKNGCKVIRYQQLINAVRPDNGWLGMLVATDNTVAGNTAAYEIKQEMFRIADEQNENIYVETTIPRVMLLYKAAGYIEYDQIKHPYEDLTVWFLRRTPHTFSRSR